MAQVIAVSWIPRSYIHLSETYGGIDKTGLKIASRQYLEKSIVFKLTGFEGYSEITFTQDWSGLHYFATTLPDEDLAGASRKFLTDMQKLFVEVILKNCHTVTYKQVLADIMPIDFHIIALTSGEVELAGYKVEDVMGIRVAYKPEASYSSGELTYIIGSEDSSLAEPLLFYSYTEIACDFLMSMMKSMVRLYHEADNALSTVAEAKQMSEMKEPMDTMDKVLQEATEKNGKLKHALVNFKFKEQEFYSMQFDETQQGIAKALKVSEAFRRLESDGTYMSILWGEVLRKRLKNIDSSMRSRMGLTQTTKKSWF